MTTRVARAAIAGALITSVTVATVAPTAALAQQDYYDEQNYAAEVQPPQGQYAEPPPEWSSDGSYDPRYRESDERYAEYASRWSQENCVRERQGNAVAGAVIGGVLGAVVGSNVAGRHDRTEGAVIGGALGATAGAAVGANSGSSVGCPPGYVTRAGAVPFAYTGYGYGPGLAYAPAWYRPWVWAGGRWVYRPYRYWYWNNRRHWRPRNWRRR